MLSAFDKHPSGVTVTAFGDRALSSFGTATVFPWDETEEGHELSRMLETAQVSEFANDGHGGDFLEPFAGHESLNDGLPFPGIEDGLHVFFEAFDAIDAGVDGLEVFFQDNLVRLIGEREFAEITHVRGGPFGFARVVEAVAKKEGVEALFGTSEIVTGVGPSPAEIADSFIESRGNANLSDVAIAEELGDVLSIAFVGLDLVVRFAIGFGRSHDDTVDLELTKAPGEDEASGTGFIADVKILESLIELLGKSAFDSGVAATTRTMIDGILARSGGRVGDGDRVLVDIETDVVDCVHACLDIIVMLDRSWKPRVSEIAHENPKHAANFNRAAVAQAVGSHRI